MSKISCQNNKPTIEFSKLTDFMKIIADKNRLRIICLLKNNEKCVCEIHPNLNLAQNLVSSHLKVMLDFGLIKKRQESKKNFYFINHPVFDKYILLLNNIFNTHEKN